MQMRDLTPLWSYERFDKTLLQHYGLHEYRHILWDNATDALFYVVQRSSKGFNDGPGNFAVCERTLNWMQNNDNRRKIRVGYVVLVEKFGVSPPPVVNQFTINMVMDRLYRVAPQVNQNDGNTYWWLTDEGKVHEPVGYGPMISKPPF